MDWDQFYTPFLRSASLGYLGQPQPTKQMSRGSKAPNALRLALLRRMAAQREARDFGSGATDAATLGWWPSDR